MSTHAFEVFSMFYGLPTHAILVSMITESQCLHVDEQSDSVERQKPHGTDSHGAERENATSVNIVNRDM